MLSIKQLAAEERPRERLEMDGVQSLSNPELVAILLGSGTSGENVISLAQSLVGKKGLDGLADTGFGELRCKGIGKAKACRVVAAFELGRRAAAVRPKHGMVRGAADAVKTAGAALAAKKETFVGLYINSKNRLLKKEVVSLGSLDRSIVHPREVFKPALECSAAGVIVLHNHPSGDPTPSEEDVAVTKQLLEAGKVLGIPLLDHIVVGKNSYASMRQLGVISQASAPTPGLP